MVKNVLIIESAERLREALTNLCTELGFEQVFSVETGARGIEICQQEKIDLVISDGSIVDMTGVDILHFVQSNAVSYKPPVILLTQDTGEDYRNALIKEGASVVLAKPFNGIEFKEKVSLLVETLYGEKLKVDKTSDIFPDLTANVSHENVILVVDDEPANIELATNLLKKDYKVRAAINGKKALDIVKRYPDVDLILLDIMMPEMDGYEVCKQLKANAATRDIPIIFLTAKSATEYVTKGFELGAVDYIAKPLIPDVLKARVKTHVSLRNSHQRLKDQIGNLKEIARLREDIEKLTHHDLKGPLGVILFELYKIKDASVANAIEESVTNVLNMINNSLDVFKIEQGQYEFKPQKVDLKHLIDGSVRSVGRLSQQKELTINVKAEKQDIYIFAEELLCMSIFNNLVKNAAEASPDEGVIDILMEADTEKVRFTITNSGAIPEDLRENLFDKYATSNHIRGSGLGTYSAKLMTECQQGQIGFEVINEEQTRFTVCLPAA